jgi:hypothetical protein
MGAMQNLFLMIELDYSSLFLSFIITFFVYTFIPISAKLIERNFSRKFAHKFSLFNSIAWGLIFIMMKSVIGDSALTSGAPILFYFVNKWILLLGSKAIDIKPKIAEEVLREVDVNEKAESISSINDEIKTKEIIPLSIIETSTKDTYYCLYCGTAINESDQFCGKCGKKTHAKLRKKFDLHFLIAKRGKTFMVLGITIVLISSLILVKYLTDQEKKRVNFILENQDLYWNIEFNSPNGTGEYISFEGTSWDGQSTWTTCVVVGIKVSKDKQSKYYLDNKYDDGKIELELTKFTVNGSKPWVWPTTNECMQVYDVYKIHTDYEFELKENETINLLFIIDSGIDYNKSLKYDGKEITKLAN